MGTTGCRNRWQPCVSLEQLIDTAGPTTTGKPMEQPSDWFWAMLEAASPSLAKLEAKLVEATKEELRRFGSEYRFASESLCDYWDGPVVFGIQYSEDDTEDVCNWIVSQGRELWHRIINGEIAFTNVAEMLARQEFARFPIAVTDWTMEVADPRHCGYQAPSAIAAGVYFTRFGCMLHEDESL